MTTGISVWIVEDEPRYRERFALLLQTTDTFRLTGSFESYAALSRHLGEAEPPDLIVMDLQLPEVDGFAATRALSGRLPGVPVVALTLLDDPPSIVAALTAGATGYVVKGTEPDRLFRSLREAHAGGTYFAPAVARHVLGHFAPADRQGEPLSDRERQVLRELAAGRTKVGIAEALFLSPHTVDTHLRNVYRKLHVRTAAEAAAQGVRSGLI